MFTRTLFDEEHRLFRETTKRFINKEIIPHHARWEHEGKIDRSAWRAAGEAGLLCCELPQEYGGSGADFRASAIVVEELARAGATGPGFYLHSDIVAPYLRHYGTREQKQRWLPAMARGETIGAIAMSEPAAGSDLQGIETRAKRDGNHLVLNGQKTFISNGQLADLVIVVAKTDPSLGAKGISLVLVEGDREGFERGANLEKIGYKAQDTSTLYFDNVRVPMTNLLGEEGRGFVQLMEQLPQERLLIAIRAAAIIETALESTVSYTGERQAFGRALAKFQNTRFKLAEIKTQAVVTRIFVDRCIEQHLRGELTATDAAIAKLHTTELMCDALDSCLQLHGGYGYMWEFPIARAWADARMARIAGGSSEIMKEIIGRTLWGDNL